jgi:L-asparaginase II
MEETNGKILAKPSADAVYSMTILEEGIGIAVKIECGTYRALDALISALLLKHEYLFQAI